MYWYDYVFFFYKNYTMVQAHVKVKNHGCKYFLLLLVVIPLPFIQNLFKINMNISDF